MLTWGVLFFELGLELPNNQGSVFRVALCGFSLFLRNGDRRPAISLLGMEVDRTAGLQLLRYPSLHLARIGLMNLVFLRERCERTMENLALPRRQRHATAQCKANP